MLRDAVLSGVFRYRYKNVTPTSVRIRSSSVIEMIPTVRIELDEPEVASARRKFSRALEDITGEGLAEGPSDATISVGGMSSYVVGPYGKVEFGSRVKTVPSSRQNRSESSL